MNVVKTNADIRFNKDASIEEIFKIITANKANAAELKDIIDNNIDFFSSEIFNKKLNQKLSTTKNLDEQILIIFLMSFIDSVNNQKETNRIINDQLSETRKEVEEILEKNNITKKENKAIQLQQRENKKEIEDLFNELVEKNKELEEHQNIFKEFGIDQNAILVERLKDSKKLLKILGILTLGKTHKPGGDIVKTVEDLQKSHEIQTRAIDFAIQKGLLIRDQNGLIKLDPNFKEYKKEVINSKDSERSKDSDRVNSIISKNDIGNHTIEKTQLGSFTEEEQEKKDYESIIKNNKIEYENELNLQAEEHREYVNHIKGVHSEELNARKRILTKTEEEKKSLEKKIEELEKKHKEELEKKDKLIKEQEDTIQEQEETINTQAKTIEKQADTINGKFKH